VTEKRAGFGRRHRWLAWVGGGIMLALIAIGVAISVVLSRLEPILRAEIVAKLEERFHAHVELDSFHISLVKGLTAEGRGLRIWPPSDHPTDEDLSPETPAKTARVTVPRADGAVATNSVVPLIRLAEFRFHAPLHYRPGLPIRISLVELKGLNVDVPPKTRLAHAMTGANSSSGSEKVGGTLVHFEVDNIECRDAHLTLESSKPGKMPLMFAITHIKLSGVNTTGRPMHFDAELTNPRPAGTILSWGNLGPWAVDDPGETPVAGSYRFEHADLSVFKAIAGILSSTGSYQGVLRDMVVDGKTDTPDFRLKSFGTPLPLKTTFHAQVDGTNGDTWLQPVDATLGQSHLTAVGRVVREQAETLKNGQTKPGGHDIVLQVNIDRGRIEDFLKLASHSGTPLLTGDLKLKTSFDIPPGTEQTLKRMKLNGSFVLDDAEFTSAKIQDRVDELSMRGQGRPKEAKSGEADNVHSGMQSDFQMASEVVTLPNLKYTVPGAEIDLKGTYGIDGGALDFGGTANMQATVSQLVGGWKGLLLKPVDPLFKKNGAGTRIPIAITGTRESPKFGLDFNQMKHTSPEVPGGPQNGDDAGK